MWLKPRACSCNQCTGRHPTRNEPWRRYEKRKYKKHWKNWLRKHMRNIFIKSIRNTDPFKELDPKVWWYSD